VDSSKSASTTIVDDTTTGAGLPYIDGPAVTLTTSNTSIAENGGEATYSIKLVDKDDTDETYAGQHEEITVILTLTGNNGAVLDGTGTDINFALTQESIDAGVTWTPSSPFDGTITLVIPEKHAVTNAPITEVTFKGTAVADSSQEVTPLRTRNPLPSLLPALMGTNRVSRRIWIPLPPRLSTRPRPR